MFSTLFSQMASAAFVITFLFLFSFQLDMMVKRSTYTTNNYRTTSSIVDAINFTESNYFFGFSLAPLPLLPPGMPDYSFWEKYMIYSSKIVYFENTQMNEFPLDVVNCKTLLLDLVFSKNPQYQGGTPNKCVYLYGQTLGGNSFNLSENLRYLTVQITVDTDKIKIDNPNNYSQIIKYSIPMLYYYPIVSIDLANFENPFKLDVGLRQLQIDIDNPSAISFFYEINEVHTHDGYFSMNSKRIQRSYSGNYIDQQDYTTSNATQEINLLTYPMKFVYHRKYMDIQDVMNNVNSVINLIYVVLFGICQFVNQFQLRSDFLNSYCKFKVFKVKNRISTLKMNKTLRILNNQIETDVNVRTTQVAIPRIETQDQQIQDVEESLLKIIPAELRTIFSCCARVEDYIIKALNEKKESIFLTVNDISKILLFNELIRKSKVLKKDRFIKRKIKLRNILDKRY